MVLPHNFEVVCAIYVVRCPGTSLTSRSQADREEKKKMCPKSTQRKQDKTSKNTWLHCTLLHAQLERHHTKTCAPSLECIIDIRPSKVAPELHVPSTENAQHVDSLWLPVEYPLKMYLATCWVLRSCEVTIIIWVHKAGNSLYILIYVQFFSFHVLCLAFIYLYNFRLLFVFSSQCQKQQNIYKNVFPHTSLVEKAFKSRVPQKSPNKWLIKG